MKYSLFVIVCFIIHIIINVDIFRKKQSIKIPALKAYRVFIASVALYFLSDLLWGVFEENKLPIPLYIDTSLYFLLMGFSILAWMRYTIKYLEGSNKWYERIALYAGNSFFLAEIILIIINIFTPVLFSVDLETCQYYTYKARNIMLYVQFLMYFLLIVYSAVFALRSRDSFRRRYITIVLYSIVMGSFITAQIYMPYLPVYSIGCIIGSVLLSSFVINDIKEEYNVELKESRELVAKGQLELNETKIIAYSDPLTGVKNKHAYGEKEEEIDKLIAQNQMDDFAVAVFDLNGLKYINDTKGHEAGDLYIIEACHTIEKYFGKDNLYRFGGDEFVVLLFNEAYENRNKNLVEFERYIDDSIGTERPIISSGISKFRPGLDNTYHAVFKRADKIMYSRKDVLKEHGSI